MDSPPIAPERVLPTLNQDGTRRRLRPKPFSGRVYRRRRAVAYGLMVLFIALPLFEMNGKPLVWLNLPAREFTFFGTSFYATDGVLLMLLMLSIFVGIIWATALVGRAWCGWGCPQTVYMEFLFRPIERLIEGGRAGQLRIDRGQASSFRRVLKNVVFAMLSVFVANVFLAYFVSVDTLARWMTQSPFEHPQGFLVMAGTAGLVFFDFAYFREQMCTVACPYARLQSALLDPDSLIIGYDEKRGEPRGKGRPQPGRGDCVDCAACVVTCPTGIDIRQGLQLECIACAQCVDACDSVMAKFDKPPNLIRYTSNRLLAGGKKRVLRPRVVAYGAVLTVLVTALVATAQLRSPAEVTVLRGIGAPFVVQDAEVRNQLRVKVENHGSDEAAFRIELLDIPEAKFIAPENPLLVGANERRTTTVFVVAPRSALAEGSREVRVRVTTEDGFEKVTPYRILGPRP